MYTNPPKLLLGSASRGRSEGVRKPGASGLELGYTIHIDTIAIVVVIEVVVLLL